MSKFSTSEHSEDIKEEILQITEAFNLGKFISILSYEPSHKLEDYIFTQFETTTGIYNHYYRIKT